ncbi:hypothetical protein EMMF5_000323 [Cystobasidiomycetes sp. EMM_F5]
MTLPVAGILALAAGVFFYGNKSVNPIASEGRPSKHNPPTSSSMKNSPPEEGESTTNYSKIMSQGTSATQSSAKDAFQESVKGTRAGGADAHIDNRTPSKERVARGGN